MDYTYTFLVFPTEILQKRYQDLLKGAMSQFGNGYRNIRQKKYPIKEEGFLNL